MKKAIIAVTVISMLAACKGVDKKEELDKLKKEQSDLKEKINKLEGELHVNDTAAVKSKLVGITEMSPSSFNHYIEVQAKVEGDQDVQLSAESSGTVTSVNVRPGDHVSKGQVLAIVEDKLVRQNMSELQSQLDLATQLYNRQKNLWDQKIGSEVQYLQAKTNKEATERRMDVMKQQLDMTRIKSPINGTVDAVDIKVGQIVMPGVPAIRVVNLSALKVKGEVAESYITKVKKGNDVVLYFPDQNKEIDAKVDYSGGRIDPLNRTFNVEVRLSDKQQDLHPNMITIMKIVDYHNPSAFVVPVGAVQKSAEGQYVYVTSTEGSKTVAKRKNVVPGMIYNGLAEIKSGLDKGDKVITNGYQNVIEGDAVSF
jgi:membrane fusion protein (multidrug efflux system)